MKRIIRNTFGIILLVPGLVLAENLPKDAKASLNFEMSPEDLADASARIKAAEQNLLQQEQTLLKQIESKPAAKTTEEKIAPAIKQEVVVVKVEPVKVPVKIEEPVKVTIKEEPIKIVPVKEPTKIIVEAEPAKIDVQIAKEENNKNQEALKEFQGIVSKNTILTDKLETYTKQLTNLKAENANLKSQLARASSQIENTSGKATGVLQDLKDTKDRLAIAEIEVERLSSLLGERNEYALTGVKPIKKDVRPELPAVKPVSARDEILSKEQTEKSADDMMIATVISDKVNLRTGPGKNNSPLMSISKGTKLVIETKLGDWYRVISPTGARAWIASDVVAFGKDADSAPSRTVQVAGFNSEIEDAAFKNILGITSR